MNYIILVVIVIAVFGCVIVAAVAKEFRHAFLVPEGYASLLYHKGKFAGVLGPADTFVGVATSHWAHRTSARPRCSCRGKKSSPLTTSDSRSAWSSTTR